MHEILGLTEADSTVELGEQARGGVHGADDVVHLIHSRLRWLDNHVDPLTEHCEVRIGDQGRNLD
jgi:hypothetical protein